LLQSAIEGLLFYHPAVWWISGVLRAERENCCDDFAVAIQGDPHAYATALATIETRRWRATEPVLAANQSDLLPRIRRVLQATDARDFNLPLIPAAMLLIAAGFAIADQAPQLSTLPLKIPVPQAPLLKPLRKPMLMAQAKTPAPAPPEMRAAYRKWLNEDVVYIITDEERKAFKALATDEEREKFVEQFWLRRDPTPGTPENEFRDEHYRRIAYANSRFTASVPGWKTDRGRIYIQYGPPDEIESHPSGNEKQPYPFEQWRYRLIEGIGNNVIMEFDDTARTRDYHMTMDPDAKLAAVVPDLQAPFDTQPWGAANRHVSAVSPSPGVAVVSVQLDFADDVNVAGAATNSSGFAAAWFNQTVSNPARMIFNRLLQLPQGSYTISVTVKELKTGETHSESVSVQVK